MKKKRVILLLLGLSFLLSLSAILYPLVSNMQAEKQKDAIVLSYQEAVHSDGAAQDILPNTIISFKLKGVIAI